MIKAHLTELAFKVARARCRQVVLPILTYHRVLDDKDPYRPAEPDISNFTRQLRFIKKHFQTYTISNAVERLKASELPNNAICITFDDGYKDNLTNAARLLIEHEMVATFYIATGYLNGGCMWNDMVIDAFKQTTKRQLSTWDGTGDEYVFDSKDDKISTMRQLIKSIKYYDGSKREELAHRIRDELCSSNSSEHMMTNAEVKKLYDIGMEIGGHTVSHPILMNLKDTLIEKEILEGKNYLENIIDDKVSTFAYPNGRYGEDYNKAVRDIVERCGFLSAVTTESGVTDRNSDFYQMNRMTLWGGDSLKSTMRFIKNVYLTK
ncbi:MAG: polysaccharide deacetylase family protein [Sedimenticola sp.]